MATKKKSPSRWGVGSNQYAKRARVVEDFEVDGQAAMDRARTVEEMAKLNQELVGSAAPTRESMVRSMFSSSSISAGTNLPDDISERTSTACSALLVKRGDMTIPQNAANAKSAPVARSLAKALRASVSDPSRVKVAVATGMSRRLHFTSDSMMIDGESHNASRRSSDYLPDEQQHVVVVTDVNHKNPHVIDPTISRLAPVPDKTVPVSEQLDDEGNPYGDFPLVMRADDYLNNSGFGWDDINYAD